jgi:triacylglycerol lipase
MTKHSRLAVVAQIGIAGFLLLIAAWTFFALKNVAILYVLLGIAFLASVPAMVVATGVLLTFLTTHRKHAQAIWSDALRTWYTELAGAIPAALWWQPFRWRHYSNAEPKYLSADQHTDIRVGPNDRPVFILLHGFVSNRGLWNPWLRELKSSSIDFVSVNLEPLFGSIDNYVEQIEEAVSQAEKLSCRKPIVICHSMGGLAIRKWLVSRPNAQERIGQIVTIATPHFGTWLGIFSLSRNGREMRCGSRWLLDLEAAEKRLRPNDTYAGFLCWYSNCDNIVVPASSARLPGADNRRLKGIGHLAMVYNKQISQIEQYLGRA